VLIGGEGRTPKCPRADKATLAKGEGHECPLTDMSVAKSNVQKRGGHVNVHGLSLRATLERGKDVIVHGG
jgi:hypothetical protein